MLAQRDDGGARDEGHVGQLDAVALLVLRLLLLAKLDDARHVHLEDGVDMRAGALGLDHALRDDGAHLGHRNQLAGLRLRRGRLGGSGRGRRRSGAGAAAAGFGPCSRWLRMSVLVMRPEAPVPGTWVRSTLLSFAILRTSGEERTRSPPMLWLQREGAAAGAAAAGADAWSAAAAGARLACSAADHGDHGVDRDGRAFRTLISVSTPATGDGISASTLSVEISKMGSSR